jgi:chromosome segregation ATPase
MSLGEIRRNLGNIADEVEQAHGPLQALRRKQQEVARKLGAMAGVADELREQLAALESDFDEIDFARDILHGIFLDGHCRVAEAVGANPSARFEGIMRDLSELTDANDTAKMGGLDEHSKALSGSVTRMVDTLTDMRSIVAQGADLSDGMSGAAAETVNDIRGAAGSL